MLARERIMRLINEGVTLLDIKSGYGLELAIEEKLLFVAAKLAAENAIDINTTPLTAYATPAEYRGNPDGYIVLVCKTIIFRLRKKGYLTYVVDLFCESVGFSVAHSECVLPMAQMLNIPVKGHVEQLSLLARSW